MKRTAWLLFFGVVVLQAALAEERQPLRTLGGHRYTVYSLAFSPRGETLASGSTDKTIRLWEVATGRCKNIIERALSLTELNASAAALALSRDGRTLASDSPATIGLWDIASGRSLGSLQPLDSELYRDGTSPVAGVAFAADGKTIAAGIYRHGIQLWSVVNHKKTQSVPYALTPRSLAFSPDGGLLTSGDSDGKVRLWDVKTMKNVATLDGHIADVVSVAFSHDGRTLAAGGFAASMFVRGADNTTMRLWDIPTRRCIAGLPHRLTAPSRSPPRHLAPTAGPWRRAAATAKSGCGT